MTYKPPCPYCGAASGVAYIRSGTIGYTCRSPACTRSFSAIQQGDALTLTPATLKNVAKVKPTIAPSCTRGHDLELALNRHNVMGRSVLADRIREC